MFKILLLLSTPGIASTFGGTLDYAPDHYGQYYYPYPPPEAPPLVNGQYTTNDSPAQGPPAESHGIDDRFGALFAPPPFPGGTFGVGLGGPSGGLEPSPPLPPGLPDGFVRGPPPNGPIGPPPFGFSDPGFQTQTGFEGLLVPNSWYGLLPWGIEGVIIVIVGIIVFAIIVIGIIGLLAWFCGIKTVLPILKSEGETVARSRFGDQWAESLVDLSVNVIEGIERFNEVMSEDSVDQAKKIK